MKQVFYRLPAPEGLISDPSLVLYLPLYQLDGASITSKDAYGHLCSVTGSSWRPGGRYFDGVDDDINCGNDSAFDISGNITIVAWYRFKNSAASYSAICEKRIGAESTNWAMGTNHEGKLGCFYSDGTFKEYYAGPDTRDGSWYHGAIVLSGSSGTVLHKIYVEGDLKGSSTTPGAMPTNSHAVWIGRAGDDFNDYFKGWIGEVLVYSRALTTLEIQYNYLATKWRYQ